MTYTRIGDYYIPDISLGNISEYRIGKYGRMRQRFLKEFHPILWGQLAVSGELWEHLFEIEAACCERLEHITSAMAKQEGITEKLKAENQMEWVGRMNGIRNRAEEIILSELVYGL